MCTHESARLSAFIRFLVLAVLCLAPLARAEAAETITATAHVKGAGGAEVSVPVQITVDRFSTDAERDQVMAALKQGGTNAVRDLLAKRDKIGTIKAGTTNTPITYAYARTAGSGRLITAVTATPIAFVGAGLPGAKPKAGYELGLVLLDMTGSGPGQGEVAPAAKVRLNDQGAIVTEDYGADAVRLSNVTGK